MERTENYKDSNRSSYRKVSMLDISGNFLSQGARVVPVGDPLKQKTVLLEGGGSSEEIRGTYQAWNSIGRALQSEVHRSIYDAMQVTERSF